MLTCGSCDCKLLLARECPGIIDRLDYIEGMGFDCIWITPVVKSLDYTGYFAEDFFDIDPHIGTKETLRALSKALHNRGMCLVLDIVANHVRPLVVQSDWSADAIKTYLGVEGIKPFDKEVAAQIKATVIAQVDWGNLQFQKLQQRAGIFSHLRQATVDSIPGLCTWRCCPGLSSNA